MHTIYYTSSSVNLLNTIFPSFDWSNGVISEGFLTIEATLSENQVREFANQIPTVIKGVKPGPRCGSPTGGI